MTSLDRAIIACGLLVGSLGAVPGRAATSLEGITLVPPRPALQQPVIQSSVAGDTEAQIGELQSSLAAWKVAAEKMLASNAAAQRIAPSLPAPKSDPFLKLPLPRLTLTSRFGLRQHPILGGLRSHDGIDIAAAFGTPVRATGTGVVSRAEWAGGYGLLVVVNHDGPLQTRYAHMSRLLVSPGQRIATGDLIGLVGSTGRSTGPHLHYEVTIGDKPVNPLPFLAVHSPFARTR